MRNRASALLELADIKLETDSNKVLYELEGGETQPGTELTDLLIYTFKPTTVDLPRPLDFPAFLSLLQKQPRVPLGLYRKWSQYLNEESKSVKKRSRKQEKPKKRQKTNWI